RGRALNRIPYLEKKIGFAMGWSSGGILRARPGNWIHLRDIWKVFHAVRRPRVTICSDKLDTRRDRVRVRLVNNRSSDRKNMLRLAAHVDVWEDGSTRNPATSVLTKRSTENRRLKQLEKVWLASGRSYFVQAQNSIGCAMRVCPRRTSCASKC